MWRAFSDLAYNNTPAVNGEKRLSLTVSSTGARSSTPLGPRPPDHGRGQGRVPFQSLSWQTESSHHSTVMPISNSSDPWLHQTSTCWPLEEQHCAEGFAISASFKTDNPPLWSGLISPSTRADALRGNRGLCLNCHDDNHSFKHCRRPFINASDCLNPEQYHQDQGQLNCHNHNTYTSDHHGGIPPLPTSCAPASAPEMCFGAVYNPGGNPNARQPVTFRIGN